MQPFVFEIIELECGCGAMLRNLPIAHFEDDCGATCVAPAGSSGLKSIFSKTMLRMKKLFSTVLTHFLRAKRVPLVFITNYVAKLKK